jgi:hypothetical protein
VLAPAEHLQVAQVPIADDYDVSAATTIATIGPATRYMRLTAERNRPVPAGPGLNEDASAILEHRNQSLRRLNGRKPAKTKHGKDAGRP